MDNLHRVVFFTHTQQSWAAGIEKWALSVRWRTQGFVRLEKKKNIDLYSLSIYSVPRLNKPKVTIMLTFSVLLGGVGISKHREERGRNSFP